MATVVVTEKVLNSLTPYQLYTTTKKRIEAGFSDVAEDSLAHLIIEHFLLDLEVGQEFRIKDVCNTVYLKTSRPISPSNTCRVLITLQKKCFPTKLSKRYIEGQGKQAIYFLTDSIKKIYRRR
ncbi:MAG: hypothetical protein ACTSO3_16695 [Candidatus Heimdallarchaeaceae archaeon]